ncbi:hypothetical protein ACTVZO_32060 [Streptomyces sp. IBSNAI002]|uniref:hypothetical protein n=1 Tax=Streptomyces sp. IBSNAI002 TaxID=3457500 RepID=UPI003FD3E8B5
MSPTRTRTRAAAAAAAALLGPLLLAGCGIKPTGPVDSGSAATVDVPVPDGSAVLYFVSPEGHLVPSPQRDVPTLAPLQALTRLLDGPGERELAAGLTTQVPSVHGRRLDTSVVTFPTRDVMRVQLPFAAADLTPTARRQLVCTLVTTGGRGDRFTVALKGTDAALDLEPAACEGAADRPLA